MTGPEASRDLELIEDALREGRVSARDPHGRELQELALALEADSPEPDPEFAAGLDERVADGFGRAPKRRPGLVLPARIRGGLLPALGVACVLLAVVGVAVGVLSGGSGDEAALDAETEVVRPATPAASDALSVPGDDEFRGSGGAPPPAAGSAGENRKVERSAQLTLAATKDRLQSVADNVGVVAERNGGYVLRSQVSTGDDTSAGGSFVLRVPSDRLQTTLADLSKLGKVTSRSETGQDLTATARRTEDKLGELLIERRALRDKLRDAEGDDAVRLRSQLRIVTARIDDLSGRMQQIRRRTVYSTVSVTLEQREADEGAGSGGGDSTGDALRDALDTLLAVANFLVRALGVLLPLALLAALAGFALRALRRRRREAALF